MRWAIAKGIGATQYYRKGYANALASCGYDVSIWDPVAKPPADLYAEKKFTHLLCGSWELTSALVRNAIAKRTELFLFVPNWGTGDSEIDPTNPLDTIQTAEEAEKAMVGELRNADILRHAFTYYHQKHVEHTHNGWNEIGVDVVGLPLAADILAYPLTKPDPNIASDFSWVGGRWKTKAHCIDPYLFPLCHPSLGLSGKVYGNGHFPIPQHLGSIQDDLVPKLFASSKICPCIFEIIAVYHPWDLSERVYKTISSGGFPVAQHVEALRDIFTEDEVVSCKNPSEFVETVVKYCNKPEDRIPFMQKAIKKVYSTENYHMRLAEYFRLVGNDVALGSCIKNHEFIVDKIFKKAKEFSPHLFAGQE